MWGVGKDTVTFKEFLDQLALFHGHIPDSASVTVLLQDPIKGEVRTPLAKLIYVPGHNHMYFVGEMSIHFNKSSVSE